MRLPTWVLNILIIGFILYIIVVLWTIFQNDTTLNTLKEQITRFTKQPTPSTQKNPYTKALTPEEKAKQKGVQFLDSQYSHFPSEFTQLYLLNNCKIISLSPLTEKKIQVKCTLGELKEKTTVTFYIRSNVALESAGFADSKLVLTEFAPNDTIRVKVIFIPEESKFSPDTVKRIVEKLSATQSSELGAKALEFYGDLGRNKTSLSKIYDLFTKSDIVLDESTFLIDEIVHYPLKY